MASPLPPRATLVGWATEALRERLRSGHWKELLPGERRLAEDLQISRETLRQAIHILTADGWIKGGSRTRRQILLPASPQPAAVPTVALLTPAPLERGVSRILIRTDRLRSHLAGAGIELVIKHGARYFSERHHRALQKLVREVKASCWILQGSTPGIQRWFAAHQVPALVMGPCLEGIDLPSIDTDFQAITRHAAGLLLQRGHRRIAFISHGAGFAGDHFSRLGIEEAIARSHTPDAMAVFLSFDGTLPALCRALDSAFCEKDPPTALIAPARTLYTAVSHLAQRRIIATQDYAFVARDDDNALSFFIPSVARYEFDPSAMARRLYAVTMKIVNREHHDKRHLRLMPRFVPGDSLECRALTRH